MAVDVKIVWPPKENGPLELRNTLPGDHDQGDPDGVAAAAAAVLQKQQLYRQAVPDQAQQVGDKGRRTVLLLKCQSTESGRSIKKTLEPFMKTPVKFVRLRHISSGRVLHDETPLSKLGCNAFSVELQVEPEDPGGHPLVLKKGLATKQGPASPLRAATAREPSTQSAANDVAKGPPSKKGFLGDGLKVQVVVQQGEKPFLGGYRNTRSGTEYHHAICQTVEGRKKNWNQFSEDKTSRMVQAVATRNAIQQTDLEKGTQTATQGFHVCTSGDRAFTGSPARYVTAADHRIKEITAVIKLQRVFRKYRRRKEEARAERQRRMQSDDNGGINSSSSSSYEDSGEDTMNEPQGGPGDEDDLGPRSFGQELAMKAVDRKVELQKLYNQLEAWRVDEEKRILGAFHTDKGLRSARSRLVSEEAHKLSGLSSKRDEAREACRQDIVRKIIVKAGQPKVWFSSSTGKMVTLETPGTLRAKSIAEVFLSLTDDEENAEGPERLVALNSLADLVADLEECQLTDDILDLVDREEGMIRKGMRAQQLEGVRKRILHKFLQLARTPQFNPEILRFEQQLPMPILHGGTVEARSFRSVSAMATETRRSSSGGSGSGGASVSVYLCFSCRRYLDRSKFKSHSGSSDTTSGDSTAGGGPAGAGSAAFGRKMNRCQNCERLDNNARSRKDLSVYKDMLANIRRDEVEAGLTSSPIFVMQDSDVRYVIRSLWDSRSVLCGLSDLYELRLIRWDKGKEWSPWNCVLLTKKEAAVHLGLRNLQKAYGKLLVEKIQHKHTLARNHFSKIPAFEKWFKASRSPLDSDNRSRRRGRPPSPQGNDDGTAPEDDGISVKGTKMSLASQGQQ